MTPKTKNYLIAFLSCTTLGAAGYAFQQRQLLAEAKAAPKLQITQSNFTSRPAEPLSDRQPAAPAPIEPTEETSITPAAASANGDSRPGGGSSQGRNQWGARMTELMKDPEFVAALRIEQEARIDQRYGELFNALKLAPEKLAAFKGLLIDRENASRDVMASAMSEGLDPRDPENRDKLRELTKQLQTELEGNIKTTLGEAAYSQLQAFNKTQPQRATVSSLNQKLSLAGQPLNSSQSQQLTRIIAETGTVSGRDVLITDQTISVSRGVLMPSQVAELEKLQAEQTARQVIQSKTQGMNRGPRGF